MTPRRPSAITAALICLLALLGAKAAEDAGVRRIEIKDRKYAPARITIKAGQTVVWTNRDDSEHTVIAEDKSFKSDDLGRGESFRWTFKKPGKYRYFCRYHPREKGEIIVE